MVNLRIYLNSLIKSNMFKKEANEIKHNLRLSRKGIAQNYRFKGKNVNGINPESLMQLYDEIFVNEPYYFNSNKNCPFILDLGSNIGTSILYFKSIFPNSKIIAFEPNTANYKLCLDNLRNNDIDDVILYNNAISDKKEELELLVPESEDQACSLNKNRINARNLKTKTENVKTVLLSDYITETVDFLKMDIEGAEESVIKECEDKLHLVDRMFIEFHYTYNDNTNNLSSLLSILDRNNYNYLILSGTANRIHNSHLKPFTKMSNLFSLDIFCKKNNIL